jgi:chemosensory pili system protein ChpA (sensor histidine kinase/response regulator)
VEAVALLQEQVPDIMLLDIEMPRMDGYELTNMVRSDERLKHIPIIMITSRTGAKHRDHALELGVDHYLGKPYQETELMDAIRLLVPQAQ